MAAISYQYDHPTFSGADLAKYPYLAELPERCPCDKIRLWSYKSGHPINEHVKTCVAWSKRKAAAKEGKTYVPQMQSKLSFSSPPPKKVRSTDCPCRGTAGLGLGFVGFLCLAVSPPPCNGTEGEGFCGLGGCM